MFRLETGLSLDDPVFTDYGLNADDVQQVRRFALDWYSDLCLRLAEGDIDSDQVARSRIHRCGVLAR
ncbi:hypothetical protein [Planotetraspora mira]|uniref:Uncharacterized protein n=1 Tax=Planotetraspora mira TaxID=58121 RepID=A0A8J3X4W4_9ACTN|nr:hypothetical protein [Planotetraspora mira]GII27034.1 hypothetical protein Pmi06nite_04760 [Planotetraspora mira]